MYISYSNKSLRGSLQIGFYIKLQVVITFKKFIKGCDNISLNNIYIIEFKQDRKELYVLF